MCEMTDSWYAETIVTWFCPLISHQVVLTRGPSARQILIHGLLFWMGKTLLHA